MPTKRDLVRQSMSYGWIVFLCAVCGITGIALGWTTHRAFTNVVGEDIGFVELAIQVTYDNPYAVFGAFVSLTGLVLQFIRTFRGRRSGD